jgi:hypothetical protein
MMNRADGDGSSVLSRAFAASSFIIPPSNRNTFRPRGVSAAWETTHRDDPP